MTESKPPQPLTSPTLAPRRKLVLLAAVAAVGLIYASILPVGYRYMALDEAWRKFLDLPWLNLGLGRRADWVANGLAILPFGFLAAGACDRRVKTDASYVCCLVAIMATGMLVICGIEFLQIWFPIRTLSINDIAAGITGAILGPLLWLVAGRQLHEKIPTLNRNGISEKQLQQLTNWLLAVYCLCLAAYSVLPLDIMLRLEEWQAKAALNRFEWAPHSATFDLADTKSVARTFFEILKSGILLIPVGVLAALSLSKRQCVLLLLLLPILLEGLQAPVFTRHTVYADVLSGWLGGVAGVLMSTNRRLIVEANKYFLVRLILVAGMATAISWAFLGGATTLRTQPELTEAWNNFFTPPFAKYYFMDEFNAFSNALKKVIVFATLGYLTANLFRRSQTSGATVLRDPKFAAVFLLTLILATAIEVGQIYLIPFVGDATDILLYTFSGVGGWLIHRGFFWLPN